MTPRQQFEVTAELQRERADLIVSRLAGLTRSVVSNLFADQRVGRVDGLPLRRSDRLEQGDQLWVEIPEPPPGLVPISMDIPVLYEDRDLAVIDKPSGLVTHPGSGTTAPTLAAGVLAAWPHIEGVGAPQRWGLVHRLDKDTSGALLIAKTQDAYEMLTDAMAARRVGRTYRALCHGLFEFGSGTIDAPLARDRNHPTIFTVDASGRPARTHYERMERWPSEHLTMVRVTLETGRTHQIRVHMASIDHPVVGDIAYGGRGPDGIDPGRVWLHAETLRFHDMDGTEHAVSSPLPVELRESLAKLGSGLDGVIG